MTFELQYTDTKSNARAGLITTDHGQIQTPIFMPCLLYTSDAADEL